jgi:hypothetical protein
VQVERDHDRVQRDFDPLALHLQALRRGQRLGRDIDAYVAERDRLAGQPVAGCQLSGAEFGFLHQRGCFQRPLHKAHFAGVAGPYPAAHRHQLHPGQLGGRQQRRAGGHFHPPPDRL